MCNALTAGYTITCHKDSVGGLLKIRLAVKNDIDSIVETDNIVTAINMKTGKQFFDFALVKNTANFTIVPTVNVQSGTSYFAEAMTMIFNKMKASTSILVDNLIKSSLVALVEDRNGETVLLGRVNGLDVTGGTIGSGTAAGDRNGYELQFAGEEEKVSHVDPTIIAGLIVPAV